MLFLLFLFFVLSVLFLPGASYEISEIGLDLALLALKNAKKTLVQVKVLCVM